MNALAKIDARTQRHLDFLYGAYLHEQDTQEKRDERIGQLASEYEAMGDFDDAIGSTSSGQWLNEMYAARKLGDAEKVFSIIDGIMECAAAGYAEAMIKKEDEEQMSREKLVRARRYGLVPARYDD